MNARVRCIVVVLAVAVCQGGCSAPQAAADLIAFARDGLTGAKQAQDQQHEYLMAGLAGRIAALDAAFDADVRLAEAGGIRSADGEPVALSAEWVISARKGYSAARGAVAEQMRSAQAVHFIRQDNLQAADEALHMAEQLIVDHSLLGRRIRQALDKAREELTDGE